jgi:replicative DNA helicase
MSDAVGQSGSANFNRYDKTFQEKILQALLTDSAWSAQMVEVMTPEYFELKYLHYLADKYFDHFKRHRVFPTIPMIASIARDDLREDSDRLLVQQIVQFLHKIKFTPNLGDLAEVKERAIAFCRKQAMKEALIQCVDLIEEDKNDSVVEVMKNALAAGVPASIGHDFFEDFEARFSTQMRLPVPTGIEQLDRADVLAGGLSKGELGVVVANTGVGKSHMLVNFGAYALQKGKNVLHYTFELSETKTAIRYDSNLCNIPSNDVINNKELIRETYDKMELGRLIIKEYPSGSASIVTLRAHIEKLHMKSFRPHLILVDYADIMRSSRSYDTMRHELALIYVELRNLSQELGVPIWTASQANRDSANADIVGLENMAEAYGKAMVADVVISLSRKAQEKSTGFGRMFVAKNRAGKDGLLFHIKMDTARSLIRAANPDEEQTFTEAVEEDEAYAKGRLRDRYNELKKEIKKEE